MDFEKDSGLLKALGHPVRLQMVCGLIENECHVNKMVERLGLPQSTVSQHLGILKNQGIFQVSKQGPQTCYRVVDVRVKKIVKILLSQKERS